jgi:hypothetical protein
LAVVVIAVSLVISACDPVKMPHEVAGPPGCGARDPALSGPSTMSVAQNMTLHNQGTPAGTEPNEWGGRDWVYYRSSGSVFGETQSADVFRFDALGLLKAQTTEVRRHVGK